MIRKIVFFFVSVSLVLAGGVAGAAVDRPVIQVTEKDAAVVGSPFRVRAKVLGADRIDEARLYFRAPYARDFAYVNMTPENGEFAGLAPAPARGASRIEQVILARDSSGHVYRSRFFETRVSHEQGATSPAPAPVVVYSEAARTPDELDGFAGDYTIRATPAAAAKLGVVAGLVRADGGTPADAGVQAAGSAPASAKNGKNAGLSKASIAGIAAGAVALVAVAAGNSGGSGGDSAAVSSGNDSAADNSGAASGSGGGNSSSNTQTRHKSVHVGLAWNNTADVDLHVTDPCGHRIDHLLRSAVCQGYRGSLNRNANDEHRPNPTTNPSESIDWSRGAPKGHYSIRVRMQDNRGNGPTHVSLVVKIDGKTVSKISTSVGAREGSSVYTNFNL